MSVSEKEPAPTTLEIILDEEALGRFGEYAGTFRESARRFEDFLTITSFPNGFVASELEQEGDWLQGNAEGLIAVYRHLLAGGEARLKQMGGASALAVELTTPTSRTWNLRFGRGLDSLLQVLLGPFDERDARENAPLRRAQQIERALKQGEEVIVKATLHSVPPSR